MNANDNIDYNPAEDENQGVITKLVQGESAGGGVAQADYMNPVTNQGPEPVKEEVNDGDDIATNGVNDDMLVVEDVENDDVQIEGDDEE